MIRKTILQINPYVPGKPAEEVKRELGLTSVIKLASNENPYGPSTNAIKAMQEACQQVNVYPDASSYQLKKAIAAHYQIDEGNIFLGNGSDENIKMIAQAFLNPEEEVIVGTPSFSAYDFAGLLMDGVIKRVPLKNHHYQLQDILAQVTTKTKLIFICNPNNPTGTVVSQQQLTEFLDELPSHVIVALDEAYAEYVDMSEFPDSLEYVKQERQVIVLRTFSKIYGLAGTRIGYALSTKKITGYLERVREPFNVNLIAQAGAQVAIQDGEHIEMCHQKNREGLTYLKEQLASMGLSWVESQANFMLIDVKKHSKQVFEELMQLGIIIRPGYIWGLENYIRVTVGKPQENTAFIEALKKVL